MNNKQTRKMNKGFSYIELLVVIGIMAIMVGMVSLSVSIVSKNNVRRGAEKLQSGFNQARSMTMAKGSKKGSLELSYADGKWYYYVGDASVNDSKKSKTMFAQSPVVVQLVTEHGNVYELSEIGHYTYKFSRGTGGLKKTEYPTVRLTNGDTTCDLEISELTGRSEIVEP